MENISKLKLTNFRDLGGLNGIDNRTVKMNTLLRAGEPVGLCSEDNMILKEFYNLKHIIDFRGIDETLRNPVDNIEGAKYHNFSIFPNHTEDKNNKAPSFEELMRNMKIGTGDSFLEDAYINFVTGEQAIKSYRDFIDILLNHKEDGSILFHCFAGKDRSGWAAVIILKILGVSDQDILSDFLKTNLARKDANEIIFNEYRKKGFSEDQMPDLEAVMTVKSQYLIVAFNQIDKLYGSFDDYLKKALKLKEEEIQELRNLYLTR